MQVQFVRDYIGPGLSFAKGDVADLDDTVAKGLKKDGIAEDYVPPKDEPAPAPVDPVPSPVPAPQVDPAPAPVPAPVPLVQRKK